MKKFHLKTSSIIKGDFGLKDLNLLLVFQVNCPGCFAHAFPLANNVYDKYQSKSLNVLGLSTTFEDFEFNDQENTKLLIEEGTFVGETKRFFDSHNIERLPYPIKFPIAFDQNGSGGDIYTEDDARKLCMHQTFFDSLSESEQKQSIDHILQNLSALPNSSYTFTINRLMGTPSWIIIDSNYIIKHSSFGHKEEEEIFEILDKLIMNPEE